MQTRAHGTTRTQVAAVAEAVTPAAGQLSRNPSGFSAFLRKIRGAGAVADSAADAALAVPRCAAHFSCSPPLPGLAHLGFADAVVPALDGMWRSTYCLHLEFACEKCLCSLLLLLLGPWQRQGVLPVLQGCLRCSAHGRG